MRVVTVDIGGSGVKTALYGQGACLAQPAGAALAEAGVPAIGRWLRRRHPGPVDAIAVAIPGMVGPAAGQARFYLAPAWIEADLAADLTAAFGAIPIVLSNDAEAAAIAAAAEVAPPLLHLTLGTGVGGALVDERGRIVRPHGGASLNVSMIGAGAAGPAWKSLGATALGDLERDRGRDAALEVYAGRIAILAGTLAMMAQPRTITLSGGIPASYPGLEAAVALRLPGRLPHWYAGMFGVPAVRVLPDAAHAVLRGLDRIVRSGPGTNP